MKGGARSSTGRSAVAELEITAPINRARTRLAVIKYMKKYHVPPPSHVRKMLFALYGDEIVDGFDEGVDLGMCYEHD